MKNRVNVLSMDVRLIIIFWIFGANGAFLDSLFAEEEEGRIRAYLAAHRDLFYTTKHSLIRVGDDVKQS